MALFAFLRSLISPSSGAAKWREAVYGLYQGIVAQARQPAFYQAGGVPDTVEGRFEVVALHAWLVMRRLSAAGPALADFNQALFDHMFTDLDFSLRELGASEMVVGKKVKDLAKHFYGRADAYEAGLRAGPQTLGAALDRNLLGSTLPDPAQVAFMAAYVGRAVAALEGQPVEVLASGVVSFPPPQA